MLRNELLGAVATWALLAGVAVARDVEERAVDGAADPIVCDDDGPRAEASDACTDAQGALAPFVTPTIATEPATSGEPARAAFDQPAATATETTSDAAARDGAAQEHQPNASGPEAPDYWRALP